MAAKLVPTSEVMVSPNVKSDGKQEKWWKSQKEAFESFMICFLLP